MSAIKLTDKEVLLIAFGALSAIKTVDDKSVSRELLNMIEGHLFPEPEDEPKP